MQYINTNSYIAKFKTTNVPSSLIYMGKHVYLEPFVQRVRRCQFCQRFSHLAKMCRTSSNLLPTCVRCGSNKPDHDAIICKSSDPKCINCVRSKFSNIDISHEASSSDCPVYLRQRNIKRLAAFHDLSPLEAKRLLDKGVTNVAGG